MLIWNEKLMKVAILAENLSRRFGDTTAVDALNLAVSYGEVFGFLGPNGAGKTTTVRLLNGVLTPSAGRAIVLDREVGRDTLEVRRRTGVLTEAPNLYEGLTARENLLFWGDVYGVSQDKLPGRVSRLLEEFGLASRGDDPVSAFSKGMKQRMAIAKTLLHEPELIFLDEPTSGLDPEAARMVTDLIQRLSRRSGRTVFLCTHNLDEAQRLCDRVGIIDRGVLRAVGTPKELAQQLWPRPWVDIDLRGAPALAVQSAIEHLSYVHSWAQEGEHLAIELSDEEAIPDTVAAISSAGGRIYRVTPREYTLSEIYFAIQSDSHQASHCEETTQ